MKKFTLIVALFFTTIFAFSQTPLTVAADFTATDVNGVEHNLFEILDGGQYVCIDFWKSFCSACTNTVPFLNEAYNYFGCNTADVFVIGVNLDESHGFVSAYYTQHGLEFPAISGIEGGGSAIH